MDNFCQRKFKRKLENIKILILYLKKYKNVNLENDLESYNSILFIYKLFGKKEIIRSFNHYTFSEKLIDNEDIYNIKL